MQTKQKRKPTVSVILPLFNGKIFLEQTIKSVLNQSFKDFEFIIIDDGSTDKPENIYNEYKDQVKIIKQENSGSPAKAKNRGIKESQGDFIAFIDQDDLWLPEKLEKQVKSIGKDSVIGLVLSNASVFDSVTGKNLGVLWQKIGSCTNFRRMFLNDNFVITSSQAMVRKEVFKNELFDEKMLLADDYELWYRISKDWKIEIIKKVLVKWRYSSKSLSNDNVKMLNDLNYFYEKAELMTASKKEQDIIRQKKLFYSFRKANLLVRLGKTREALKIYNEVGKEYKKWLPIMIWLVQYIPFLPIVFFRLKKSLGGQKFFPNLNLDLGGQVD